MLGCYEECLIIIKLSLQLSTYLSSSIVEKLYISVVTEVLMRGRQKFNLWYSITTMITYDFLSHDLD